MEVSVEVGMEEEVEVGMKEEMEVSVEVEKIEVRVGIVDVSVEMKRGVDVDL